MNAVDSSLSRIQDGTIGKDSCPQESLDPTDAERMDTSPVVEEDDPVVKGILAQVGAMCDRVMESTLRKAEERINQSLGEMHQRTAGTSSLTTEDKQAGLVPSHLNLISEKLEAASDCAADSHNSCDLQGRPAQRRPLIEELN